MKRFQKLIQSLRSYIQKKKNTPGKHKQIYDESSYIRRRRNAIYKSKTSKSNKKIDK